jgi:hypothetical protein
MTLSSIDRPIKSDLFFKYKCTFLKEENGVVVVVVWSSEKSKAINDLKFSKN